MKQISAPDLQAWLADGARPAPGILDVREPWEVERSALAQAVMIPMRDIPARAGELDRQRPWVVFCHHGARSMQVGLYLEAQGFADVSNLAGGINAWSMLVDPSVPRY
jgi:rhodanese-related sulfurtransferase